MILEEGKKIIHVFKKKLVGGDYAIAVFNLGETEENVKVYLDEISAVRDLWAKKDLKKSDNISIYMYPHTTRVFRVSKIFC